jgi:hypothetical protein
MTLGFLRVGAGEWVLPEGEDFEVYLLFDATLCHGRAPSDAGAIVPVESSQTAFAIAWSYTSSSSLKVANLNSLPGDTTDNPHDIVTSTDAGASFGPAQHSAYPPRAQRRDDEYIALEEGIAYRTVTGGSLWHELVSALDPSIGLYQQVAISTLHAYLRVQVNTDLDTELHTPIYIADATAAGGGSGSELLHDGHVIGQVGDGMLICDRTGATSIFSPMPIKRFTGPTAESTSGLPDEFTGDSPTGGTDDRPFFTYNGAALKGTTAICTAQSHPPSLAPTTGFIYRSTNSGRAWSQVHTWTMPSTTGKFGTIEIGYAGHKDGIWWVGGGGDGVGAPAALWRSDDDGQTWSSVPVPTDLPSLSTNNTPAIVSAARPEDASR